MENTQSTSTVKEKEKTTVNTKPYNILFVIFGATILLLVVALAFIYSSRGNLDINFYQNDAVELNAELQQPETDQQDINNEITIENTIDNINFQRAGLTTDTSQSTIDLSLVLSGGPPKDGIPAIRNPRFIELSSLDTNLTDDVLGVVYEYNDTVRFYSYNILVWHEIVDDQIDDHFVAITFCPLCGSAIAYNREVNGEVLDFGVSGLLYESNLLMYDTKTESLWSQIEGRSVVGEFSGTELEILPIQVLEFGEFKSNYATSNKTVEVLSDQTGFTRDYSYYPYGNYDNEEALFFPVTYNDQRLFSKEIMYSVRSLSEIPVAFVFDTLKAEGTAQISLSDSTTLTATFNNGEVQVVDDSGNVLPGFFTQWFSWANHNLPQGVNPDAIGEVWGIN